MVTSKIKAIAFFLLYFMACCLNNVSYAQRQNDEGIHWVTRATWEDVKQKAIKENKYIFVDAYATWCGPCKMMDRKVYTSKQVVSFMNNNFINVKLQMDSTTRDDADIKRWYPIRAVFEQTLNVKAFPTYLFFSPKGDLVHRGVGLQSTSQFLSIAKSALDKEKQNLRLMEQYKNGVKDYSSLTDLWRVAHHSGRWGLANQIMLDYKFNYLDKLPAKAAATSNNFELITNYLDWIISTDGFFQLAYHEPKKADSLANMTGFSKFVVETVITKEEITNKLFWNNKVVVVESPQWDKIQTTINSKYAKINAEKLIIDARIDWCKKMNQWDEAVRFFVLKVEKYGLESLGMSPANNIIDVIVMHCTQNDTLNKALNWVEVLIDNAKTPIEKHGKYGAYAALLYKLGRVDEAVGILEKRIDLIKQHYKEGQPCEACQDHLKIIDRMRKGEPINSSWEASQFY